MTTTRTVLFCLFAVASGFGVGFGLSEGRTQVQANALSATERDRLIRELDTKRTSLVETSETMSRIAKVTMPAVVHILASHRVPSRGSVEETGSGAIVQSTRRPGNYVVTNRHVIHDALPHLENIQINLSDGRTLSPTRVWEDPYSDVAVMQIDVDDVLGIDWGDSEELEIGHVVMACGSPFGLSQSMTMGIISARGRSSFGIGGKTSVINQDFLQTDAAINPGNSGGPLIDLHGRLVGINTAIASTHGGNEGIGFSIPSNLVRHVVDHLLQYGKVKRAYLGVKLDAEFDFENAKQLKLYRLRGARVLEVYPNTPAAISQIRQNDVILEFDGREIRDESHLINLVSLSPVGKSVKLIIWRDGRRMTLNMDLITRPIRQAS